MVPFILSLQPASSDLFPTEGEEGWNVHLKNLKGKARVQHRQGKGQNWARKQAEL